MKELHINIRRAVLVEADGESSMDINFSFGLLSHKTYLPAQAFHQQKDTIRKVARTN